MNQPWFFAFCLSIVICIAVMAIAILSISFLLNSISLDLKRLLFALEAKWRIMGIERKIFPSEIDIDK